MPILRSACNTRIKHFLSPPATVRITKEGQLARCSARRPIRWQSPASSVPWGGGERTRFDGVINVHGEYRHRQVTYVPDRDAAGRVVGFYGLGYDLTDRVRQQNALLEREKHMRSVFSAMAEGLVIHDKNGRIIDVNPAAADILGLSRDQLLGKTSWDPAWQATREDATPCPGAEHPAMITLRTG